MGNIGGRTETILLANIRLIRRMEKVPILGQTWIGMSDSGSGISGVGLGSTIGKRGIGIVEGIKMI